jgi:hypothetical protein
MPGLMPARAAPESASTSVTTCLPFNFAERHAETGRRVAVLLSAGKRGRWRPEEARVIVAQFGEHQFKLSIELLIVRRGFHARAVTFADGSPVNTVK